MANFLGVIKKELRPRLEAFFDDRRNARDKTFFAPTGTQMYAGRQGSGKTLSAVKHMLMLKGRWPQSIIVSNLDLKYFEAVSLEDYQAHGVTPKQYIFFASMDELARCLTGVNNDTKGVIYLIDEIHTYFNALDSKNIPMYVFTEISQQRKQRKVIIATSQLFLRVAKPFREQCDNVIKCWTWFGFITFTKAYDGAALSQDGKEDKEVHAKRFGWYFHTRYIRDAYDTYQKVVSGAEQYGQQVSVQHKTTRNLLLQKKDKYSGIVKSQQNPYSVGM